MQIKASFENGVCYLTMTPEDKWEKKLLGAIAKGGKELLAKVEYTPEGHFSYGNCEAVHIEVQAKPNEE